MSEKTGRGSSREVADNLSRVEKAAIPVDSTPPPDHDAFVEARSAGLRAVRANLARRKKKH